MNLVRRPTTKMINYSFLLRNLKKFDLHIGSLLLTGMTLSLTGMTALHQAALDGNLVAVRLLVRHGADVNKQDDDTWTPLHAACAEGHVDIARYVETIKSHVH